MAHNSQLAFHVANMLQGINVTEANLFIQHHSETKECWFEALGLLDANSMQVQFFAATILHTKVSTSLLTMLHCRSTHSTSTLWQTGEEELVTITQQ